VHYFIKRNKLTSNRSDDNCQLVDQLVANLTTAYLQHLTMYSIYMQSYLLLTGADWANDCQVGSVVYLYISIEIPFFHVCLLFSIVSDR